MKYVLATGLMSLALSAHAGDLRIQVKDIRNDNGNILISVFDNEPDFNEINVRGIHTLVSLKAGETTREVILRDFPEGKYAITVLHDENRNSDMDTNARGLPVEGYAYSKNVGKRSQPSFKSASFRHEKGSDSNQKIKVIYLN